MCVGLPARDDNACAIVATSVRRVFARQKFWLDISFLIKLITSCSQTRISTFGLNLFLFSSEYTHLTQFVIESEQFNGNLPKIAEALERPKGILVWLNPAGISLTFYHTK